MNYWKIAQDSIIIGAVDNTAFRKWQQKHNILLACDVQAAEYLIYNDILYHDTWLEPVQDGGPEYETAEISETTQEEAEAVQELLEIGQELLAESEEETTEEVTTETAAEAIEKIGLLDRLEALEEAVFGAGGESEDA